MINSKFLPIFHRQIAKKKRTKTRFIKEMMEKRKREKKKKREDGNTRDSLLLGQEEEEKEDGRLQSLLQSAV